ncbi:MAG: DUF6717 family protein [Candidatus Thermoplasmatota archaeon]|nr:DUF6717 family protein [Candidatus Thermoplasmatota archaeon]
MNAIMVINPYKWNGMWVFDDENTGLVREPFVAGADEIIDVMVEQLENAGEGFALTFSHLPFPGHDIELVRQHPEAGGWWYHCPALEMTGWLCPALFLYFEEGPIRLYARFTAV